MGIHKSLLQKKERVAGQMWGWREERKKGRKERRDRDRRKRNIFFFHWLARHQWGGLVLAGCWLA